mmetsp:Transcript_54288/g.97858  ORF Transcript_54288/g.97858 Transcript_54288/m.97858 type:complete len:215 (+) Transcript_54288:810-1454(+)
MHDCQVLAAGVGALVLDTRTLHKVHCYDLTALLCQDSAEAPNACSELKHLLPLEAGQCRQDLWPFQAVHIASIAVKHHVLERGSSMICAPILCHGCSVVLHSWRGLCSILPSSGAEATLARGHFRQAAVPDGFEVLETFTPVDALVKVGHLFVLRNVPGRNNLEPVLVEEPVHRRVLRPVQRGIVKNRAATATGPDRPVLAPSKDIFANVSINR